MNYYDIEKIYDEMEQYLIDNIKKNLMSDLSSFHLKEEKKLGFNWEAWQTTKLRELKRYRKENKNILHKYVNNIDSDIRDVLRREYLQGKKSAYKGFKMALKEGFKSSVKVKDSFFRINDRKLDALIRSVNNDFKKANQAVLRMTNDTYRQVIFEASMYNNTGVMTSEEAIRKAIGQFEARGINSIEYSNGARHKISNYARMAIRTASTRAYLQGNGEFRKKIGQTLVILSKHGTACKLCQPWEGKVLIDDVYSGGTKKDGKYPLLSDAMKQGLYHPNCRHALGTYYPELSKKDNVEITEQVEKEETQPISILDKKVLSIADEVYNQYKNNGFENLALVNSKTGKRLGGINTNKSVSAVGYSSEQTQIMQQHHRDLYSIHNHPANSTFSIEDILENFENDAIRGTIVRTDDYDYYFEPKAEELDITKENIVDFTDWIYKEMAKINDKHFSKFANYTNNQRTHSVYKEMFNKLGWKYGRKKRK